MTDFRNSQDLSQKAKSLVSSGSWNSLLFIPWCGCIGDGGVSQVHQGGEATWDEDVDSHGEQVVVVGQHHDHYIRSDFY